MQSDPPLHTVIIKLGNLHNNLAFSQHLAQAVVLIQQPSQQQVQQATTLILYLLAKRPDRIAEILEQIRTRVSPKLTQFDYAMGILQEALLTAPKVDAYRTGICFVIAEMLARVPSKVPAQVAALRAACPVKVDKTIRSDPATPGQLLAILCLGVIGKQQAANNPHCAKGIYNLLVEQMRGAVQLEVPEMCAQAITLIAAESGSELRTHALEQLFRVMDEGGDRLCAVAANSLIGILIRQPPLAASVYPRLQACLRRPNAVVHRAVADGMAQLIIRAPDPKLRLRVDKHLQQWFVNAAASLPGNDHVYLFGDALFKVLLNANLDQAPQSANLGAQMLHYDSRFLVVLVEKTLLEGESYPNYQHVVAHYLPQWVRGLRDDPNFLSYVATLAEQKPLIKRVLAQVELGAFDKLRQEAPPKKKAATLML